MHLRHQQIPPLPPPSILRRRSSHSLLPPPRTETPFTPIPQADGAQIVPPARREIEELVRHGRGDGVVPAVLGTDATEAVAVEARHQGVLGEETEGLLEYCEGGGREREVLVGVIVVVTVIVIQLTAHLMLDAAID